MIGSLSSFIVSVAYPAGSDALEQSVMCVMLSINILISLLMLPINIRLAAQLIMQVFKYRYILKHVADGDVDPKVMRGYYDHFRVVMCIILFMIGFNVFNIISSVYFLVYFVKSDWGFHPWYIYIAEGLYAVFQDGIILFAITLFYQIACYFEEKTFRFQIVCFFALLRSIYMLVQVGVINNLIINKYTPDVSTNFNSRTLIIIIALTTLSGFYLLESFIRFPFVFSFVRVSQRDVKTYINQFNTDLNTQFLDRSHYVDKIQASMLFQIAGWGTIFVSFFTSMNIFGQYLLASILLTFEIIGFNFIGIKEIVLISLTIIQIVTTLPVILYSLFLIALWLYFRYKTKAKYSGYSSNDPKIIELIHNNDDTRETTTNQDALHTTYYKPKTRIMISVYVVTVLIISLLFACFSAPLLTEKWKQIIQMKSGDYYILNKTDLGDNLNSCHKDLSISVFNNPYSPTTPIQDCQSNTIYAAKFVQPLRIQNKTYTYVYQGNPYSDTFSEGFWIPKDSVLIAPVSPNRVTNSVKYLPYMAMETVDPCYVGHGYLSNIFSNEFGIHWCKNATLNKDFSATAVCYQTSNTTVNCTIQKSGMFTFNSYPLYYTRDSSAYTLKFFDGNYTGLTYYNGPITVQQFGYEVNESTLVPLREAKNQIDKYDVILAPTSENITNLNSICTIQFTCDFNLAVPVLIPVLIFTVSMVGLALGLFCIYKI